MNEVSDIDWSKTSYKDAVEAAISYALVDYLIDVREREYLRGPTADLSDINKGYRRRIRSLANGELDAEEFLRLRE